MQGLGNKTLDVALTLEEYSVDIFCASETWIEEGQQNTIIIPGYTMASYYNRSTAIRGGSAVFVKSNLDFKARHDICNFSVERNIEISCVFVSKFSANVVCFYRPPLSDFNQFINVLEIITNKLTKENKSLIICGDFNEDFSIKSSGSEALIDLFLSYNMTKVVHFPTRINKVSSTCIDNIFTNISDFTINEITCSMSDHGGQQLRWSHRQCKTTAATSITKRKITSTGLERLQEALINTPLKYNYINDPNNSFDRFLNNYITSLNHIMPVKQVKQKTKKNSMTGQQRV